MKREDIIGYFIKNFCGLSIQLRLDNKITHWPYNKNTDPVNLNNSKYYLRYPLSTGGGDAKKKALGVLIGSLLYIRNYSSPPLVTIPTIKNIFGNSNI